MDDNFFIEPIPFHTPFKMDGNVSLQQTDDYLYEGIDNILNAVGTDMDFSELLDLDEQKEMVSRTDLSNHPKHPIQQTSSQIITALTRFDVVAGRGQGIQRLPGNETFRKLVSMHKRIYARCNMNDKGKVSKGIVAAIRSIGGRFLQYNEQSQAYHDIPDKKAWGKTSQALREGLKKIRNTIYSDEAAGRTQSGLDAHLLGSLHVSLPAERYLDVSIRLLQSIHEPEKDETTRTCDTPTLTISLLPVEGIQGCFAGVS